MENLLIFLKIISDKTRLRILLLLLEREMCVCELQAIMNESQPKISKHLAKLKSLNLISDRRAEKYIYYSTSITNPLYKELINIIKNNHNDYPLLKIDIGKIDEVTRRIRGV
ncbi:metalloregulator ArsR/SmtB family transcription factor [Mycoplasmatota bacterium zrk1]